MAGLIERRFGLQGRIASVTGSSAGIGAAIASGSTGSGATVVVNGRNADKVTAIGEKITAAGSTARGVAFDVTRSAELRGGVAKFEAEIGPIDILFNNAGIQPHTPLDDYPEETWRERMSANLDGVIFVVERPHGIGALGRRRRTRKRRHLSRFRRLQLRQRTYSLSTAASQLRSDRRLTLIVMGVSGCGKTTFGRAFAAAERLPFFDGDDVHSNEAIEKMRHGTALNDADRWPWLDRIGATCRFGRASTRGGHRLFSLARRLSRPFAGGGWT